MSPRSEPPRKPSEPHQPAVDAALEAAWREHWGRLVGLLTAQFRRLELAEDAVADAFEAAARTWPRDGVPERPAAWLLTAARRRVLDRLRAEAIAAQRVPLLLVDAELNRRAARVMADVGEPVADQRLRLVLLCTEPSLTRESAAALTLRMVIGLDTAEIARLFLATPSAMAARLTRARRGVDRARFAIPTGAELVGRLRRATDVAYLAFTAGYLPGPGPEPLRPALAGEAVRLVRVIGEVAAAEPSARGQTSETTALLALMLLQHSRRDARVADGELVLLADQDRSRWRHDEIAEALDLLSGLLAGVDAGRVVAGPYLVQALIAAEHAIAPTPEAVAWSRIADRYAELEQLTPSPVVRLNRAVAVAEADGPDAGLALLRGVRITGHRLPGVRAELEARAGRTAVARRLFAEAAAACDNDAERRLLRRRADAVADDDTIESPS